MNTILRNPFLLPAVALLSGVLAALVPLWRAGGALILHAQQARAATEAVRLAQRAKGWDFWTIEVDNLASELKEQKATLAQRAMSLDQRAALLDSEQQELDKVRAGIEAMRKDLSARVVEIHADERKNLRSLAQTYTNLTPRAAVAVIHDLDDATVVKILSLMKPDVVGPIFEEMSQTPDKNGTMAGRVADLSEKLRLMKADQPPAAP